jgi:hypothetical protein
VLITCESSIGAFLLLALLQLYLCYYTLHIIIFLQLLSTNHKFHQSWFFLYYSNLPLRRWRWTRILWWEVLGLRCPGCIFLWIMEPSSVMLSWESFSLMKDIIYAIIILYSWHLALLLTLFVRMCGINVPGHTCDEYSVLVAKLGMKVNLSCGYPPQPGEAYPMSEWSWRLCVFLWRSRYVRQSWDMSKYSSACCQVRVVACRYVLSCLTLNDTTCRGLGSSGTYLVLENLRAWLPGARPCRAVLRGGAIVER